ncbi:MULTISPECIES: ImmA/IrrE family metallo-endopeptidase [Micrococcales]|uniref:Uncharacterized protein n=2 Tax=Micrococcales TaxID=85006 RepID=A0A1W2BNQ1_9MICO|nr:MULTISPECIES: ImmA/IrrE family metallo-endopeptidase [Micrococcales]MCL6422278.1 ImmA/IrrE family metallo-endopeptidase [Brachybacterium equifaecis]OLT38366.1 serine/arginine repetitive matrix protein 2 [Kytococcus sp. CUA-901]RYI20563.1 ImmA/IrrE family metallo-endopeptidase [Dermacoccus sp. 147Ba]SMC74464.1 protein of unknown function [Janibacter indicus]
MATREEARQKREARLDELHETLTGAVEQLITGEDWADALRFAARFRSRSFNNTLLIWKQHEANYAAGKVASPFPTYVAGAGQWQKMGRHILKGQKHYGILAPFKARFATATPKDPDSWRRLGRYEKPKPGEAVRTRMVGVVPARVFDVAQTGGDPIPKAPEPTLLQGEAPEGLWEGLAGQVQAAGYELMRVPHEGMIDGANGRTNFTDRSVAVRENMDAASQVKTLAHELGHVLMHSPDQEEARQHRGIAEVEAESVALMVGAAHGMDTSDYTIPYVSGWAATVDGTEPVEVVKATGERVRRVAIDILDGLDTVRLPDGTPPGLAKDGPARTSAGRERTPQQSAGPDTARRPASTARPERRL